MVKNLYAELGLKKFSTIPQIKARYRQLAKKHHPDKSNDDGEKFRQMTEAYNSLIKNKSEYDAILKKFKKRNKEIKIINDAKTFKEHVLRYETYMIHKQKYIEIEVSDNDALKFFILNLAIGAISVYFGNIITLIFSYFLIDSILRIIQVWSKFPIKQSGIADFILDKFNF